MQVMITFLTSKLDFQIKKWQWYENEILVDFLSCIQLCNSFYSNNYSKNLGKKGLCG